MKAGEPYSDVPVDIAGFDFEETFRTHYARIARIVSRVVNDSARADDLVTEVFWKLWNTHSAQTPDVGGWLYRVALRAALDDLRRQSRRAKYERLFGFQRREPTPEEAHAQAEDCRRVRSVLAVLKVSQSELLMLRGEGFSYQEIAKALKLNPASVGTLLIRAQKAFRKEYIKRYGEA